MKCNPMSKIGEGSEKESKLLEKDKIDALNLHKSLPEITNTLKASALVRFLKP